MVGLVTKILKSLFINPEYQVIILSNDGRELGSILNMLPTSMSKFWEYTPQMGRCMTSYILK
jgi:hypothetical protein